MTHLSIEGVQWGQEICLQGSETGLSSFYCWKTSIIPKQENFVKARTNWVLWFLVRDVTKNLAFRDNSESPLNSLFILSWYMHTIAGSKGDGKKTAQASVISAIIRCLWETHWYACSVLIYMCLCGYKYYRNIHILQLQATLSTQFDGLKWLLKQLY